MKADLNELLERVKCWLGLVPKPAAPLDWHCQCAGHPFSTDPCRAFFHTAKSPKGMFEIFEEGDNYLLFFPRSMQLPAELFSNLAAAKACAFSTLISKESQP